MNDEDKFIELLNKKLQEHHITELDAEELKDIRHMFKVMPNISLALLGLLNHVGIDIYALSGLLSHIDADALLNSIQTPATFMDTLKKYNLMNEEIENEIFCLVFAQDHSWEKT
jgi:preprotein translocase subunit Sec63